MYQYNDLKCLHATPTLDENQLIPQPNWKRKVEELRRRNIDNSCTFNVFDALTEIKWLSKPDRRNDDMHTKHLALIESK